jgi:hypothetical protein
VWSGGIVSGGELMGREIESGHGVKKDLHKPRADQSILLVINNTKLFVKQIFVSSKKNYIGYMFVTL